MTLQLVDNFTNSVINTAQQVFTAASNTSYVIDSFTASNTSGVNASYKAYIKSSTGVLSPQIPFKIVVWGENDLGIGIVNQVIPNGGSLHIESSSVNSIYFTVSGREIA